MSSHGLDDLRSARELLGDLLHVTGYDTADHLERHIIEVYLADIAALPRPLVRRVIGAGLRGVFVGSGRVADLDDLHELADEPSYDDVAGVYDRRRKVVCVGTRGVDPGDVPHDLWHEFGHAAGDLLGYNDRIEVHQCHVDPDRWLRLHPPFRGPYAGSPLGKREMFAEAVRDRLLDRHRAVTIYGSVFVRWLEQKLAL